MQQLQVTASNEFYKEVGFFWYNISNIQTFDKGLT